MKVTDYNINGPVENETLNEHTAKYGRHAGSRDADILLDWLVLLCSKMCSSSKTASEINTANNQWLDEIASSEPVHVPGELDHMDEPLPEREDGESDAERNI